MKNSNNYDLIIIGGGAAGFYTALQVAEKKSNYEVLILEKSSKLLTKVKISGGGRCNVTHHCFNPIELAHHYPRGERVMKSLFKRYQAANVVEWFTRKGVQLKTESDGRMFPISNSSQTIIDCLINEAHRHNIQIKTNSAVVRIEMLGSKFNVLLQDGGAYLAEKVVVAIGGSPRLETYYWLKELGHTILVPKPSLFTFNDHQKKFSDLMGISAPDAEVKIAGTKYSQQGPLLITHWGLSGPAVIKLSAWAAEYLYEINYKFTALVSWIGKVNEENTRRHLNEYKNKYRKQRVVINPLYALPQRLWQRLCELAEMPEDKVWAELPHRNLNKLLECLIRCPFQVDGKTTFKEEFVTCGGVDLNDIDLDRMESKKVNNLFFAGEVLNIDGETGGFNFQSAWTTAYVAAMAIVQDNKQKG
ncbi:MAG TPA: NAD(P)/FAD-dependent oxidoreductase [Cyclobacteriaceae bacterium]|nr:NAD(P)/FAD-dependent oxidoreductase [Cyclobacteriaceae bacterium]